MPVSAPTETAVLAAAAWLVPHLDRRCGRGPRCRRREQHTVHVPPAAVCPCSCHGGGQFARCDVAEDGGCGHLHPADSVVQAGALLEDPGEVWCPSCVSGLALALDELPGLAVMLDQLHEPSLAQRYRDGGSTGVPGSIVPLNEHADALLRLLDHELAANAELVADTAGVPWDSQRAAAQPPPARIQDAARLLGYRWDTWLQLPPNEYEARSLGADPRDGHDLDAIEHVFGRWWVRRDGPAAAAVILDLHRQAQWLTGGAASDWVPVPCSHCHDRALYRQHAACTVRCRSCGHTMSDGGYDAFLDAALAATATAC